VRNYLIIGILALVCFTLVSVPLPVEAQSSDVGLSIGTSSPAVARGGGVAIFALVTNNTTSKMRVTTSISAFSPCGTETSFGEQRLSLDAGKGVALSVYYPIPADACPGMYAITITADTGKNSNKNSTAAALPSTTAYVEVK
jgi:uncharacterized membrane protein